MNISYQRHNSRQLLERSLTSKFETKCHSISIGGRSFEFWSLAEPDSILDDSTIETSHEELEWQPYWAQLWDASIGLCHELVEKNLVGKTVLDLGCGLGATGAVAASQGATVVLADNAPPALEFAELNCWPWKEQVSVQLVDWKTDNLEQQFDLILGADIIYDPQDLVSLDRFWRAHLPADGEILLSEPSRAMTGDLMKKLKQLGWSFSQKTRVIEGLRTDIRIFSLAPSH